MYNHQKQFALQTVTQCSFSYLCPTIKQILLKVPIAMGSNGQPTNLQK